MDISVLQEQPLPEFFLLADPQTQRNDRSAHRNDRRVSISPMQLRHPRKVHPVPAGNQRQRQKNRRYDRQNLHNAILTDINFRLKKRLDLRTVFTQKLGFLPQPDHALFKKMEKSALLLGEEYLPAPVPPALRHDPQFPPAGADPCQSAVQRNCREIAPRCVPSDAFLSQYA